MSLAITDVLDAIVERLVNHADKPVVTKDRRKVAAPVNADTIVVIPGVDRVVNASSRGAPIYSRQCPVAIICLLVSSNSESAPGEMHTFLEKVKKVLYTGTGEKQSLNIHAGHFYEGSMTELFAPKTGNDIAVQGIIIDVFYKEEIADLLT